jgi:hypothetical protein
MALKSTHWPRFRQQRMVLRRVGEGRLMPKIDIEAAGSAVPLRVNMEGRQCLQRTSFAQN